MPRAPATRRASSTASLPQHEPNREAGAADSFHAHTRIVTPTASAPASTRRAAATEESTPPLMPTTTRSPRMASVSRAEQSREPLQLVGVRVADLDPTYPLATDDTHARHERALQRLLEGGHLRRAAALLRPGRPAGGCGAHGVLGRAHGPVVGEDVVAQLELLGRRRQREHRPRVAHRETSGTQIVLYQRRKAQQPQGVGDGAPLFAHSLRQLFLGPAEAHEELVERLSFLHRVEVLTQEVLHQGQFEALGVRHLTQDRRDAGETGLACRAPATLARN